MIACKTLKAVFALMATFALLAIQTSSSSAQRGDTSQRTKSQRHVAGQFDYYQLVLSWSPTHCAGNGRGDTDTQCGVKRKRPYGFVLHGLWPQYDRGWPEFCTTRGRPYVPNGVIEQMMDIMPSRGLIIHEYKKHGTCSGLDPATYFKASRIAFNNVKIPKEFDKPTKPLTMTAAELVNKFRAINSTLTNDAIQVVCKRGNANQLQEVKFCMTRKGAFRACTQGRTPQPRCLSKNIYIPPVRG